LNRNIEIKAKLYDWFGIYSKACRIATKSVINISQKDVYYAVPKGRLKLRIENDENAELIFYERTNEAGPKLSNYRRVPVDNRILLNNLLEDTFGIRCIVEKNRTVIFSNDTRIHMDKVDGLGDYLELEVLIPENGDMTDADRRARELMDILGVGKDHLVAFSYVDLMEQINTG